MATFLACGLGVVLFLYVMAARRERGRRGGWSGWRMAAFAGGMGLIVVAVSPPMAAWAHHDLRGHMAQHLLLGMLAPLGLVLSAPLTLVLRSLPVTAARRLAAAWRSRPVRWGTHPLPALLLDGGGLYVLYLTPLYAATLASPVLHGLVHVHFLAAGCLFAWSIAGPDPAPHRPGPMTRLVVLFVAIAGHSTLAKTMYAFGWPPGTGHDLAEIRAAAQLMYYGGDVAELLLAMAFFASWRRGALWHKGPGSQPTSFATAPSATLATRTP